MNLSIAVFMGIIVVLLVMKFELKWFHALLCVMAGLSLNNTQVGDFLTGMLTGAISAMSQIKF